MALTPEQAAAYEQLETALRHMAETCGGVADTEFITGWVVSITGVAMTERGEDPDGDEQAVSARTWRYSKRGQDPLLTRGIVEAYRDALTGIEEPAH
jgi:hypothetical protein